MNNEIFDMGRLIEDFRKIVLYQNACELCPFGQREECQGLLCMDKENFAKAIKKYYAWSVIYDE